VDARMRTVLRRMALPRGAGTLALLVLVAALACGAGGKDRQPDAKPAAAAPAAPAHRDEAGPFERLPAPERLVAIGDIHGSLRALHAALRKAGAVDERWQWVGGPLVVVFTGDLIDRGDDDLDVLKALDRVRSDAEKKGGALHILTGNHEAANVDGKFIEVSAKGFESFRSEVTATDLEAPGLRKIKEERRARAAAFQPGSKWAQWLSRNPAVLVVGDTVFVHGGLRRGHVRLGLSVINARIGDWMSGKSRKRPGKLMGGDGPLWIRDYSKDPGKEDCKKLERMLDALQARRMVVGHTIQPHINSACDGRVWRIDTGMNPEHFKGPIEVLEIRGDRVTPLR